MSHRKQISSAPRPRSRRCVALAISQGSRHPRPGQICSICASVVSLFFIFGGITSLNDVIIPRLKGLFSLTYG